MKLCWRKATPWDPLIKYLRSLARFSVKVTLVIHNRKYLMYFLMQLNSTAVDYCILHFYAKTSWELSCVTAKFQYSSCSRKVCLQWVASRTLWRRGNSCFHLYENHPDSCGCLPMKVLWSQEKSFCGLKGIAEEGTNAGKFCPPSIGRVMFSWIHWNK